MSTVFSSISALHYKDEEAESTLLCQSQGSFKICNAYHSHIEGAKCLADANRHIFGFITRGAFYDTYQAGTLIVATRDEEVVGFLRYHHRKRDLQTTLYDICVSESMRGQGLGWGMLNMLVDSCRTVGREIILLRCPTPLAANDFYERYGFTCVDTVVGKRQRLNVWRLDLTSRGQK